MKLSTSGGKGKGNRSISDSKNTPQNANVPPWARGIWQLCMCVLWIYTRKPQEDLVLLSL